LVEHHDNRVKRLGFDLKRQVGIMFSIWHRYKSGEISWETFQAQMQPVRDTANHQGQRALWGSLAIWEELRHRRVLSIPPQHTNCHRMLRRETHATVKCQYWAQRNCLSL
jgi:hypothetical protein